MDYELQISNTELDHILSFSHDNFLKGSEWFKVIEDKIVLNEDESKNLHGNFRISKARHYDSTPGASFISIYANCKRCQVRYTIKLHKKPVNGEAAMFSVHKNVEHDPEKHKTKMVGVTKGGRRKTVSNLLTAARLSKESLKTSLSQHVSPYTYRKIVWFYWAKSVSL